MAKKAQNAQKKQKNDQESALFNRRLHRGYGLTQTFYHGLTRTFYHGLQAAEDRNCFGGGFLWIPAYCMQGLAGQAAGKSTGDSLYETYYCAK